MAARRLLIIMLVLLGISSAIAIIVPKPERDDSPPPEVAGTTGTTESQGATGTSHATGATGPTGRSVANGSRTVARPAGEGLIHHSVDLDTKQPEEIELESGTRLVLTVSSKDGSELEIDGLGLVGFADPYAPAYFDVLLPEEPGTFRVSAPGEEPAAIITTR